MTLVVLLMVLALALAVGGVAFAVALARSGTRDHAEQLELLPGVDTGAPAAWAGAHTPEARMHRRLGQALRALRAQVSFGREDVMALDLRVELEQHAIATDQRLIAAAQLPPGARERALAELEVSVTAIEAAATELALAASADRTASDVRDLEDLSARIRQLTDLSGPAVPDDLSGLEGGTGDAGQPPADEGGRPDDDDRGEPQAGTA
jgi:hypothetical protein